MTSWSHVGALRRGVPPLGTRPDGQHQSRQAFARLRLGAAHTQHFILLQTFHLGLTHQSKTSAV